MAPILPATGSWFLNVGDTGSSGVPGGARGHAARSHTADVTLDAWDQDLSACFEEIAAVVVDMGLDVSAAVPIGAHEVILPAASLLRGDAPDHAISPSRPHRDGAGHPTGEGRLLHGVDHDVDVLVGERRLLGQASTGAGAHLDAEMRELATELDRRRALARCMAAHGAPCAMAARVEGRVCGCTHEYV